MVNLGLEKIVRLVTELSCLEGPAPSRIQLVKYLYLLDLYAARDSGKTYTGWNWKFHHFGPWAFESLQAIESARSNGLIVATTFESNFDSEDYSLYRVERNAHTSLAREELEKALPAYVLSQIKRSIKKYAGDTPALLHHVYFETEPMIGLTPGANLDFSLACKEARVSYLAYEPRKLSKSKMRRAKEAIEGLKKQELSKGILSGPPPVYDNIYFQALDHMNADCLVPEDTNIECIASVRSLFNAGTG